MQLRPYQSQLVKRALDSLALGHQRLLIQLPTGAGKTVLAVELIRRLPRRILYVVPREEILKQTEQKLSNAGLRPQLMTAGTWPRLSNQRIVLCMAQTLHRRLLGNTFDSWYPDLILVDEPHALTESHADLLRHFPVASIALDATPVRLDGISLAAIWPLLLQGPSVPELTAMGALVPVLTADMPMADLAGLEHNLRMGEFRAEDLEERFTAGHAPQLAAAAWYFYCKEDGRRTVAFCPGRKVSMALAREVCALGGRAKHLDGTTPPKERAAALAMLASGELEYISNCNLFVEGLDVTAIACIQVVTSTMSLARHLQMPGRGMRPDEETAKRNLLYLDHGLNFRRHGAIDGARDWAQGGALLAPAPRR